MSTTIEQIWTERGDAAWPTGRAVVIDGNTLDPSVQMMLAAQRATGVNGLSVADEIAKAADEVKGRTESEALIAYLQVLGTARK